MSAASARGQAVATAPSASVDRVLPWRMIIIDRRFRGPSESGNGGYSCGVAAAEIPDGAGAVQVTLRKPPPLGAPIDVERSERGVVLLDGAAQLVAEVVRIPLTIEPPAPVTFDEATEAARGYLWAKEGHPFPQCFVCGPERLEGDGLRIFPGAVAGRNVAAAPWTPDASLADADGRIKREIVWAALDCPSWFGLCCFQPWEGLPLLGRLAAEIYEQPRAGDNCVCVGWFVSRDGRKAHLGSAIFSESGTLQAIGQATWITVP